jgi:hypothetical protein
MAGWSRLDRLRQTPSMAPTSRARTRTMGGCQSQIDPAIMKASGTSRMAIRMRSLAQRREDQSFVKGTSASTATLCRCRIEAKPNSSICLRLFDVSSSQGEDYSPPPAASRPSIRTMTYATDSEILLRTLTRPFGETNWRTENPQQID